MSEEVLKVTTDEEAQKVKNEEFKIWKKQCPFLYDICMTKSLPSATLSVQWYPSAEPWSTKSNFEGFRTFEALLTSSQLENNTFAVYKSQCDLPDASFSTARQKDADLNIFNTKASDIFPLHENLLPLVARYSNKSPDIIGCAGKDGFVKVINKFNEAQDLSFHKKDVKSLSWSYSESNLLASASLDGTAALWDVSTSAGTFFGGTNVAGDAESVSPAILDIEFAPHVKYELVTAGEDRAISFWDSRASMKAPTRTITDAHSMTVSSLDYAPFNEHLLITGSVDGAVAVWDTRMSSASLIGLQAGTGPINTIRWSPHNESVFATGGADSQVKLWDLSLHEANIADEEEGPPELVFLHGGHLAPITDISWHPTLPWTLMTAAEDSLVSVWKVAGAIINTDQVLKE
ncbi:hypothetical protein DASB73_000260 [Starmerella bacillaris]|uniref:Histone-binding protein RBBP4-like N-terminal domain-containing protein n=1 Tax=Starmerella bacillaris TaxID=1247836 RepID=A0AAV5RC84_STABA|nr:hypothetical protein DASB73_000260 [Starmerella bacillaris]